MKDDIELAKMRNKGRFAYSIITVLWGFLGIRSGKGQMHDLAKITPMHLLLAGLLCTGLFVIGLLMLVRVVIA